MKKLISILLLSILVFSLISCGNEVETPKTVFDFFPTSFNTTKEIQINSTIKSGNELVAQEMRTYVNDTNVVTIETKVLAAVGSDKHYDETTKTESYSKASLSFKFDANDFEPSSFTLSESKLEGTLKESALSKINISQTDITGAVKVVVNANDNQISSFEISYTSQTTNTVVISTTFKYN